MVIITTAKQLEKRHPDDYYPTPDYFCKMAIARLMMKKDLRFSNRIPLQVLDPGAGNGPWGNAVKFFGADGCELTGVEINLKFMQPETFNHWYTDDYISFSENYGGRFDLIVGNPPYKLAEEFVESSLDLLNPGGHIMFLFRLAFLESKKRYEKFYNNNTYFRPTDVWVSTRRISFIPGERNSNDTAYALYIWGKKNPVLETKLDWFSWEYE